MWSRVTDAGETDYPDVGGFVVLQRKTFEIRWRADVIETPVIYLHVRDDNGDLYNVELRHDYPPRRRFIRLTGVQEIC
ncbi:MAG: hypothetical protein OXM88_12835 [bacterium]|nr:hypothetical protein [bacterium]